ncbi:MAG: hypothetical protein IPO66_01950 [Rhodanobacteraceae bacterium]|nr:hypothetical protein [Rhodanobacteraceae bacterium]
MLPNRLPGAVTIDVDLFGGLDHPESGDDHSVEILVNGTLRAAQTFDGIRPETISFSVPDGGLRSSNTLTLRVMRNAGHPSTVVYLDGFSVAIPQRRRSMAESVAMARSVRPFPTWLPKLGSRQRKAFRSRAAQKGLCSGPMGSMASDGWSARAERRC